MISQLPTAFVIMGVTGDLAARKLLPALYQLLHEKALPQPFHLIGFSRRPWQDQELKEHVKKVISEHYAGEMMPDSLNSFLDCLSYQAGTFDDAAGFKTLATKLKKISGGNGVNVLMHLAVAPENYLKLIQQLSEADLAGEANKPGWTRLLIEKPFAHDLASAETFEHQLKRHLKDEQIYRVDHYLAKDMVQNILSFRFSNDIFEQIWHNGSVQRIDIRQWETIGVDNRGTYYDRTGAFIDVGQNHLLQLLALITMDNPGNFSSPAIRAARSDTLSSLKPLSLAQIKANSFRAQYKGYRQIDGVQADSNTETFFRINCSLSHPKWSGVPITLEHGKRLGERRKEAVVAFRHETPCLCPPGQHLTNKVIFSLEPYEGIRIQFWSKKSGHTYEAERSNLEFSLRAVPDNRMQYVKEYKKLLHDALNGDQTLFLTSKEVAAMWGFAEPIVQAWHEQAVPLNFYAPDTHEATRQAQEFSPNSLRGLKGEPHSRQLGLIGLGKMGGNIAKRLHELDWEIQVYNRTASVAQIFANEGIKVAKDLKSLASSLVAPRVIWLSLTAGGAIDDLLFGESGLVKYLSPGDIIIEAGNSYYKDTIKRHQRLAESNIYLVDAGVSGGPGGARSGPSLMVGGDQAAVERLEPLFLELAKPSGYQFFPGAGAGHFVKMVHNGIEYGMMQAIAEGFAILKQSSYNLDLSQVTEVYNHGSVIESRLIGWLKQAIQSHGSDLEAISATVAHTGEGAWTVQTAQEAGISAKVIAEALEFRKQSDKNPSYAGKVLSALREQFGWHEALKK